MQQRCSRMHLRVRLRFQDSRSHQFAAPTTPSAIRFKSEIIKTFPRAACMYIWQLLIFQHLLELSFSVLLVGLFLAFAARKEWNRILACKDVKVLVLKHVHRIRWATLNWEIDRGKYFSFMSEKFSAWKYRIRNCNLGERVITWLKNHLIAYLEQSIGPS